MKKVEQAVERLKHFVTRPWYVPLVALLALLDLFILVVPTDALLVSAVLGKRRRATFAAILVAMGSSLGALLLAALIEIEVVTLAHPLLAEVNQTRSWEIMDSFFKNYGGWAIAISAISPLPQTPAIALASLAAMPLSDIFQYFCAGRLLRYGFLAWCAYHAPRLLQRWALISIPPGTEKNP